MSSLKTAHTYVLWKGSTLTESLTLQTLLVRRATTVMMHCPLYECWMTASTQCLTSQVGVRVKRITHGIRKSPHIPCPPLTIVMSLSDISSILDSSWCWAPPPSLNNFTKQISSPSRWHMWCSTDSRLSSHLTQEWSTPILYVVLHLCPFCKGWYRDFWHHVCFLISVAVSPGGQFLAVTTLSRHQRPCSVPASWQLSSSPLGTAIGSRIVQLWIKHVWTSWVVLHSGITCLVSLRCPLVPRLWMRICWQMSSHSLSHLFQDTQSTACLPEIYSCSHWYVHYELCCPCFILHVGLHFSHVTCMSWLTTGIELRTFSGWCVGVHCCALGQVELAACSRPFVHLWCMVFWLH